MTKVKWKTYFLEVLQRRSENEKENSLEIIHGTFDKIFKTCKTAIKEQKEYDTSKNNNKSKTLQKNKSLLGRFCSEDWEGTIQGSSGKKLS